MATQYPTALDTLITLKKVFDGVSPILADDVNRLRDAIVTIQTELGTNPSGTAGTVSDRITQSLETIFAGNVSIIDADGYFVSSDVEGALAELASDLVNLTASEVALVDTDGYFVSTEVEGALSELGATDEGLQNQFDNLTASQVAIVDTDGYFISTEVEGALSELGATDEGLQNQFDNLTASQVPIVDADGYFISTEVEGALDELGTKDEDLQNQFDNLTASQVAIVDTDGYFVSSTVEGALFELGADDSISPSGTGVVDKVTLWSGTDTLTSDTQLHYDSLNNRLAIGTASPSSEGILTTAGNIVPSTNDTFSLGTDSLRWADGYFGDNVKIAAGSLLSGVADGGVFSWTLDDAGVDQSVQNFLDIRHGGISRATLRDPAGNGSKLELRDPAGNVDVGVGVITGNIFGIEVIGNQSLTVRGGSTGNAPVRIHTGATGVGNRAVVVGTRAVTTDQINFAVANDVDGTPVPLFSVLGDGTVGIGTEIPTAPLSVIGPAFELAHFSTFSTDANGGNLRFRKARGTEGSPSLVADGDAVPGYILQGYDGTAFRNLAAFVAFVDGTPASGDMPGRLEFRTTPAGTTTLVERMRITQAGNLIFNQTEIDSDFRIAALSITNALVVRGSDGFVGIGTTPTKQFDVTFADDTLEAGVIFQNTDGSLAIVNGTAVANEFQPTIVGDSTGAGRHGLLLLGQIVPADDSGTQPVFSLDARQNDDTPIVTRPVFEITNNNTELVTVDASGNMGIGITIPVTSLDVVSPIGGPNVAKFNAITTSTTGTVDVIRVKRESTGATSDQFGPGIVFTIEDSSSEADIGRIVVGRDNGVDNAGTMRFQTANGGAPGNRMGLMHDGRLGIGIFDPDGSGAGLHVHRATAGSVTGTTNAVIIAENNTSCFVNILAPAANESGVHFGSPTSNIRAGIIYNNSTDFLTLRTGGNSTQVSIDSSGNVGIGETVPQSLLHVTNTAVNNPHYVTVPSLIVEDAEARFQIIAEDLGTAGALLGLSVGTTATDNRHWTFHHSPSDARLELRFATSSSTGINLASAGSTVMVFDNGGDVGIGTSSPLTRLDVRESLQGSTNPGDFVSQIVNTDGVNATHRVLKLACAEATANMNTTDNFLTCFSADNGITGGTVEFRIRGDGTTTTSFTLQHWAVYQITDGYDGYDGYSVGSFEWEIEPGMIVESTGLVGINGTVQDSIPIVKRCKTISSKTVYGVLSSDWDLGRDMSIWRHFDGYINTGCRRLDLFDGYGTYDYSRDPSAYDDNSQYIKARTNSGGDGKIWVTEKDGYVGNGDYITSSVVPGYGGLQSDDILHSYTVAKCTQNIDWNSIADTVNYEGTDYKKVLVGCTYHCG